MFEKIFSVRNHTDRKHKVVNLLGIKIKFKRIYFQFLNNKFYSIKNKNKYYEFVSLGGNCLTRRVLSECGFMKKAEQGQLSCPFDLCVTFAKDLIDILENDFEGYTKNIIFDQDNNMYHNIRYNINYNHDTDCSNDEYGKEKIITRYERRIKNFRQLIDKDFHLFFVINSFGEPEKYYNKLFKILKNLRKNKSFTLIVLDLDFNLNKELLNNKIIICKNRHYFDNVHNWWKPENLELFNNLRLEIGQKIAKILSGGGYSLLLYNDLLNELIDTKKG